MMLRKLFGKKTAQPIIADDSAASNDIPTDHAEAPKTDNDPGISPQTEQSGQSAPAKPMAMSEEPTSDTMSIAPQAEKIANTESKDNLDSSLRTPTPGKFPLGNSLQTNSQDLMNIANQNAQFWIEAGAAIQEYHLKCQQQQFKMMSDFMTQFTQSSQK